MERFGKQLYHFTDVIVIILYFVVKGNAQPSEIDMLEVRKVSDL